MNLLCQTMDRVYHTLGPQMAHPSALEKGVASLNVMHMHVSIAPHLPNEPLGGPTIMEEEISMGGTVIGCQATEATPSAHHQDAIEVHQEAGAPRGTEGGEAEVEAEVFLTAQAVIVAATGIGVGNRVQDAVQLREISDLP